MPLPDGPFIFVSYANKDFDFVYAEIDRLKSEGYKLWYDQEQLQPARMWADEIRKAITSCACFLVFITEDSVISNHVCEEIDQALSENKPFIGVYVDNVELPARLQELVRKRQTLDRHSMHQSAYERPLRSALSEYIPNTVLPTAQKQDVVSPVVPPVPPLEILPKLVCFGLVAAAGVLFFLALVAIVAPLIISVRSPDDPVNNFQAGLYGGITLAFIGLVLSGAAFAVFRVYLRRRK